MRITAAVGVALALAVATPAAAAPTKSTVRATGEFSFTTASGVLPTWEAADLRIIGIAPGSALTSTVSNSATVKLPLVAKNGSANFAAGGFRITNVAEGTFINCASPVIDTGARVVDCVFPDGTNVSVFTISSIGSRVRTQSGATSTTVFENLALRVATTEMADDLNRILRVRVFSPSVTVAFGALEVSWTGSR